MAHLSKKNLSFPGYFILKNMARNVVSGSVFFLFGRSKLVGWRGIFSFGQPQYRSLQENRASNPGLWPAPGTLYQGRNSSAGPKISISTNQKEKSFVGLLPRGATQ
jgi:hypothetical protein